MTNEKEIWNFFVSKEMLYSTDPELIKRFISPAPFSKFYLNIDVDSPGQIGQWLGLQIVKAYQKKERKSIKQEEFIGNGIALIFLSRCKSLQLMSSQFLDMAEHVCKTP